MIEQHGLVGVPYTGSDGEYIRHAVCFPIEQKAVQEQIRAGLEAAAPGY